MAVISGDKTTQINSLHLNIKIKHDADDDDDASVDDDNDDDVFPTSMLHTQKLEA